MQGAICGPKKCGKIVHIVSYQPRDVQLAIQQQASSLPSLCNWELSNNNSCLRREPFLIAKNVENTSTSLLPPHDDSEASSSPPRREPVQIPVYKTGNHTKPSCDDPRSRREPVVSGKNVEKTSTLPTPSHNHCETLSTLSENVYTLQHGYKGHVIQIDTDSQVEPTSRTSSDGLGPSANTAKGPGAGG